MSKDKISDYSATANSNTDIGGIDIDEGCAPSGINNAIRTLMKQIKDLYAGTSGDTWPVTAGGTGSGTASGARTNLGLAIGTDVQAYNAALAAIAANNGTNMMKNRIINGAMMNDQRNAGASVTPTNGQYTLDRWQAIVSASSKYSVQQNAGAVTPPVGFTKYLGVTSLSAYTVGASEIFNIAYGIEGLNVADLGWGTDNASTVIISFWVRSSLTGTFGFVINNSGGTRSYPTSYTVNSANTWEHKTITVVGDTSGTWATDNTLGIQLRFGLGVGSTYSGAAGSWSGSSYYGTTGATSVVGTNGATFYITGVQLEKGSTATSFDYRPYGTELALCQRYCQVFRATAYSKFGSGIGNNSTTVYAVAVAPRVTFRASPSITATNCYFNDGASNLGAVSSVNNLSCADGICFDATVPSGVTQFRPMMFGDNGSANAVLTATAEL
jgi:hypothetical protein